MSGAVDVLNPDKPKRIVVLASNPAVSEQTGWPIGFWWSELTHPYWEFRRARLRGLGRRVLTAARSKGTNGPIHATRAATPPTT